MRTLCLAVLAAIGLGCGSDDDTGVKLDPSAKPVQRTKVRALYSGHSLTDGIPSAIDAFLPSLVAQGKPGSFDYEEQSILGSTIRDRTLSYDAAQQGSGYRKGRNRSGENMDVLAELKAPKSLEPGELYNVLVITERHDLPWTIEHDMTVQLLGDYVSKFLEANREGDALLYHVWLELNGGPISDWIDYERAALPLWECVATAVNDRLGKDGKHVRVLPGATALVALVEGMMSGQAPGVTGSEQEKLALLFTDNVHLTPAGVYFMALVHYAAVFGASPEGATAPAEVSPELARYMQQLAWRHVSEYAQRAVNASERDMAWCRAYAEDVMCTRYHQYRKPAGGSLVDRFRHMKNTLACTGFAAE